MILIKQQIIDALNDDATFTIPGVVAKPSYNDERATYPLIVVDEQPGNEGQYVDGQPLVVTNTYQIDCYCQNTTVDGTIRLASDVASLLGQEVDTFLNENYNFSTIGSPFVDKIGDDNNIARFTLRYRIVINQDTGYVYRNL